MSDYERLLGINYVGLTDEYAFSGVCEEISPHTAERVLKEAADEWIRSRSNCGFGGNDITAKQRLSKFLTTLGIDGIKGLSQACGISYKTVWRFYRAPWSASSITGGRILNGLVDWATRNGSVVRLFHAWGDLTSETAEENREIEREVFASIRSKSIRDISEIAELLEESYLDALLFNARGLLAYQREVKLAQDKLREKQHEFLREQEGQ